MRRVLVASTLVAALSGVANTPPARAAQTAVTGADKGATAGGGGGSGAAPVAPCPFVDRESRRCVRATISIASLPSVGQQATVTWAVDIAGGRQGRPLDIALEVSPALELVERPEGARLDRRPSDLGESTRAVVAVARAAPMMRGAAVVRAVEGGTARITLRATVALEGGQSDGDVVEIPLEIGTDGRATRRGGPTQARGPGATPAVTDEAPPVSEGPGTAGITATPEPVAEEDKGAVGGEGLAPFRPVAPDGAAPGGQDESPATGQGEAAATEAVLAEAADTCVSGGFTYTDQAGQPRPVRNMTVEVWDHDDLSANDRLAHGVTDAAGLYRFCFDGNDEESGTNDVYIELTTSNARWEVGPDALVWSYAYSFETTRYNNLPPGSWNYGILAPGGGLDRPVHAFDTMTTFWNWVASDCWDWGEEGDCRKIQIEWDDDRYDGDYYNRGGDTVHLETTGPDSETVVIHEATHAVMDDVYNDQMPDPGDACENHTVPGAVNPTCAWIEGFANWTQADARQDPWYRSDDGFQFDMETPTWGTSGWANGDAVEGRVAGALIDLSDNANEAPWDRGSEGMLPIWTTFQAGAIHQDLSDFWRWRANGGQDVSPGRPLAALYGNTIDYGFRDPLQDYVPAQRPAPVKALNQLHNFSYQTRTNYWSVVALRPQAGADHDLKVFGDAALTGLLASSGWSGTGVDLVAVDSNRRPVPSSYYPQVSNFSGTAGYGLQLAQGSASAGPGRHNVGFASVNDIVFVADSYMTAGTPVYFKVRPTAGLDGDLFVFESDPGVPTSWVRARVEAAAAAAAGAGGTETLVYTPKITGYHGVVWVNKAGSGTAATHIDTTAPSGSVLISKGSATTTSRLVEATFTASDPETGVDAMRVSIDGTMDNEVWEPFVASKWYELPAGDGTKSVKVQYRNLAGMLSSMLSDSIVLDQSPPVGSVSINNGVNSTASRDVTLTFTWSDPHTNVQAMRVSLDSAFDTEAWVAPVTSQRVTLPAGSGVKTVRAQFRNFAGLVSGVYSDSIWLSDPTNLVESDVSFSPTWVARGASFTATETLKNLGPHPSNPGSTLIYLSKDPYRDGTDRHVGTRNLTAMGAGSSSTGTTTVYVPGDVPADAYFVIACADGTDTTPETSEVDNCTASPSKIIIGAPDLTVALATPPPAYVGYNVRFPVMNTVWNNNSQSYGAATKLTSVLFYASTDRIKSRYDQALSGGRNVPGLAPGATSSQTTDVWATSTVTAGTYYLIACADGYDVEPYEQSEANNCTASATPFILR